MKWGLLPSWHKGDPGSFRFHTFNARYETIAEKPMFRNPLRKGHRCVVLADGFFEWQKMEKGKKQPYFLYFKQKEEGRGCDELEEKGITPRILTMAGIFDCWMPPKSADSQEPVYSYSIITVEASKSVGWLHDRMPAVLDGEEAVERWLDTGSYDFDAALALLKPTDCLAWHPVSSGVGNVRNKSEECVKPVDLGYGYTRSITPYADTRGSINCVSSALPNPSRD
eukprot:m.23539 g.23539  ORF g.23539 m.23539 type:complete len:225 (+) comp28497_c0_seq1:81-755(+)